MEVPCPREETASERPPAPPRAPGQSCSILAMSLLGPGPARLRPQADSASQREAPGRLEWAMVAAVRGSGRFLEGQAAGGLGGPLPCLHHKPEPSVPREADKSQADRQPDRDPGRSWEMTRPSSAHSAPPTLAAPRLPLKEPNLGERAPLASAQPQTNETQRRPLPRGRLLPSSTSPHPRPPTPAPGTWGARGLSSHLVRVVCSELPGRWGWGRRDPAPHEASFRPGLGPGREPLCPWAPMLSVCRGAGGPSLAPAPAGPLPSCGEALTRTQG